MSPIREPRPLIVDVFAALLGFAAALTCFAGLNATGFLVPAATLLLLAILVWVGRAKRLVIGIVLACIVAGAGQDVVVGLGDDLGSTKLDIAGVLLLVHLLCGGPLAAFIGLPLLAALKWSKSLSLWFPHPPSTAVGAAK